MTGSQLYERSLVFIKLLSCIFVHNVKDRNTTSPFKSYVEGSPPPSDNAKVRYKKGRWRELALFGGNDRSDDALLSLPHT